MQRTRCTLRPWTDPREFCTPAWLMPLLLQHRHPHACNPATLVLPARHHTTLVMASILAGLREWFSVAATPPGLLTTFGALWCLNVARHVASLLWLHLRPSSLDRYLVTTSGRPAWALVTGATGGMGTAFTHQLASRGFNLVLHGRDATKLNAARDKLASAHPSCQIRTILLDAATSFSAGGSASDTWLQPLHDIDLTVLVNNAGGFTEVARGTLDALSADRLIGDAAINVMFPTLLIRQAIPLLKRSGRGLILNVGSLADQGAPLLGIYPGSKGGMAILAPQLNREMLLQGIDIEVLHVQLGTVYHETQSIVASPSLFVPDARSVVRAALSKVGCGRHVVVGHWAHSLQFHALMLAPMSVIDRALIDSMTQLNMEDKDAKQE
ncbi:hypothetical protein Micbo1qcDRAFT_161598, partial [Microdochium bolleyi]